MKQTGGETDYIVGVDIGGTNTVIGAVDATGALLAQRRFATNAGERAEVFADRLASAVNDLMRDLGAPGSMGAMIIASPAANAREGVVDNPANLKWGKVDFVGLMKKSFDVPITMMNDSDAAALGETHFGVARGLSSVVLLTLGTGLGAGIVLQGKLVQGSHGAAGEFGHITLEPAGRWCTCGRQGCVEAYVSATGVRRTVFELLAQRVEPSPLRAVSFADLTTDRIAELANAGDVIAIAAFERTGSVLGRVIANVVAAFDPDAVVLSGGLVNAGDLLVAPARRSFERHVLDRYKTKVRILVSTMNEGQAALLGAGCFARDGMRGSGTA